MNDEILQTSLSPFVNTGAGLPDLSFITLTPEGISDTSMKPQNTLEPV